MKRLAVSLMLAGIAVPAAAQGFPGALMADYYMSEFSIPKGWALSYKGAEQGVQVFVMDRDLVAYPQTSFLKPIEQIRRLMCGDPEMKQMIADGVKVRVDSRDKRASGTKVTKGPLLESC